MPASISEPRAVARTVQLEEDTLTVGLADGRTIAVPFVWYPRLAGASAEARSKWELLGDGEGIDWPDADEDLSVEGMLAGNRAR